MYSFDTSVFMDWQARFYPPDVFISLVAKIEGLVLAGQCSAIELVKEGNRRCWDPRIAGVGEKESRSFCDA